jgi:hypothetical protein
MKASEAKGAGEDHFQRHRAVQGDLARLVDDPHAAAGDFLLEHIISKVPHHRM